jgi:hypothetical protein
MDKNLLICTNVHKNLWIIEGKLADKNFGYKNELAYNQNLLIARATCTRSQELFTLANQV